jgi:hypothetical protein
MLIKARKSCRPLEGSDLARSQVHSCCMLRCFLSERFLAVSAWLRGMTDAGAPGA